MTTTKPPSAIDQWDQAKAIAAARREGTRQAAEAIRRVLGSHLPHTGVGGLVRRLEQLATDLERKAK